MFEHAKNISLFLIIGFVFTLLADWLKSAFIASFLSENLITLLIALVAINTTTLSVVLTKIRDLADRYGGDFANTANEMKVSIAEQVFLVAITVITQIFSESDVIKGAYPAVTFISSVVLVGVFAYAIYILYDTANSIFVILQFENQMTKKDIDEVQKEKQPKNTK